MPSAVTGSPALITLLLLIAITTTATSSSSDYSTFVYVGCSQPHYSPSSPYESAVDSALTSLVNSASSCSYNNFSSSDLSGSGGTVYSLFQCRGDLSPTDCSACVSRAVTQLGSNCGGSTAGALQLEGCLVRYDNANFLGVKDTTVLVKKCGPLLSLTTSTNDELTRRDAVLGYLGAEEEGGGGGASKPYKVGSSGNVRAVAQCVEDLSAGDCRDCLGEAIGQLKSECGAAAWGDVYLAKCFVGYSDSAEPSGNGSGERMLRQRRLLWPSWWLTGASLLDCLCLFLCVVLQHI